MYTSANRRHVNGLGVSGGVVCVVRIVPPFLNGCAVSVPRHALAMAHAIKGGKCKVWEKWPSGQPEAGGSEYLELHGAFSIALRAPGAALLRRLGFLAGRGAREIALAFALVGGALRGGWTFLLRRVAEDRRAADREETSSHQLRLGLHLNLDQRLRDLLLMISCNEE